MTVRDRPRRSCAMRGTERKPLTLDRLDAIGVEPALRLLHGDFP